MAAWRRCEQCRKVLSDNDFETESQVCASCLSAPVKVARAPRAGAVRTRHVAPTAPAAPAPSAPTETATSNGATPGAGTTSRPARLGVVGRGGPEVRGRRARSRALAELAEMHADDFDRLLLDARRAEGLT